MLRDCFNEEAVDCAVRVGSVKSLGQGSFRLMNPSGRLRGIMVFQLRNLLASKTTELVKKWQ